MQSLYILTSKNMAQQKRLNMISDNVANINTPGFKKQEIQFEEVLGGKTVPNAAAGRFTQDTGVNYQFSQGSLNHTQNPFDFAINGDAFFPIQAGDTTLYTRNGHFTQNANGDMITELGNPVLDNNGTPVSLPPNTPFTVTADGSVVTDQGVAAQIGMLRFEDKNSLARAGGNSFIPLDGQEPLPAEGATMLQGFLEDSSVNAIEESVNLTEVNRAYTSTARLLKTLEDLENRAIRQIARSQ